MPVLACSTEQEIDDLFCCKLARKAALPVFGESRSVAQERFVAYRRSSTQSQTIGLEMQQSAINDYVRRTGTGIIASYQDVGAASPTRARLPNQQPQLVR